MNILARLQELELQANRVVEDMAKSVCQLRGYKLSSRSYDSYQRITATNTSDEYTYADGTPLVQACFYWNDDDSYDAYYVYFPESYLEYNTWMIAERQVIEAEKVVVAARQAMRENAETERKRALFETLKKEFGDYG